MKTIIYLVRHAEANSNINPLELDGKNGATVSPKFQLFEGKEGLKHVL